MIFRAMSDYHILFSFFFPSDTAKKYGHSRIAQLQTPPYHWNQQEKNSGLNQKITNDEPFLSIKNQVNGFNGN